MVQSRFLDIANPLLRRWTVDEYHRMVEAGILTSEDHVELLDGQIIEMVPQDPPHASRIDDGGDYLKAIFADRAKVRVQLPITLAPRSEPEPDFAIVRLQENRYRDRHPYPQDVLLLIEMADSTVKRDRDYKTPIYARAAIPEYWIVDLKKRQVTVFQHPQGEEYQAERVCAETDSISPRLVPDVSVELRQLIL
jgi:Uma2 family endonuclease